MKHGGQSTGPSSEQIVLRLATAVAVLLAVAVEPVAAHGTTWRLHGPDQLYVAESGYAFDFVHVNTPSLVEHVRVAGRDHPRMLHEFDHLLKNVVLDSETGSRPELGASSRWVALSVSADVDACDDAFGNCDRVGGTLEVVRRDGTDRRVVTACGERGAPPDPVNLVGSLLVSVTCHGELAFRDLDNPKAVPVLRAYQPGSISGRFYGCDDARLPPYCGTLHVADWQTNREVARSPGFDDVAVLPDGRAVGLGGTETPQGCAQHLQLVSPGSQSPVVLDPTPQWPPSTYGDLVVYESATYKWALARVATASLDPLSTIQTTATTVDFTRAGRVRFTWEDCEGDRVVIRVLAIPHADLDISTPTGCRRI